VTALGAVAVVAGFVFLLRALRLVPMALEVTSVSRAALAVVRDPSLDDDAKGERMQGHAKRLFGLFFLLTLGAAAALALPIGLIWLLDRAGVLSYDNVMDLLLSWPFLLGTTAVAVGVGVYRSRR
jgi:hypothetical protein